MLTELSLKARLDRSSRDVIELNVCKNSKVSCFRCLIGRAVKTYEYINHVVLMLPLSVYEGAWTHLLRLELALVFLEEERVMQHSSVSISLSF